MCPVFPGWYREIKLNSVLTLIVQLLNAACADYREDIVKIVVHYSLE